MNKYTFHKDRFDFFFWAEIAKMVGVRGDEYLIVEHANIKITNFAVLNYFLNNVANTSKEFDDLAIGLVSDLDTEHFEFVFSGDADCKGFLVEICHIGKDAFESHFIEFSDGVLPIEVQTIKTRLTK